MAVTLQSTATIYVSSVQETFPFTGFSMTVPSGATDLAISVRFNQSSPTVTSASFAGQSMTAFGGLTGPSGSRVEWFYLKNPPTGLGTLTLNANTTNIRLTIEGTTYTGGGTGANGGVSNTNTAATTATLGVTSATGDMALALHNDDSNTNGSYSANSHTKIYESDTNTINMSQETNGAGSTVNFTASVGSSTTLISAGFNIQAAAAGGSSFPQILVLGVG